VESVSGGGRAERATLRDGSTVDADAVAVGVAAEF